MSFYAPTPLNHHLPLLTPAPTKRSREGRRRFCCASRGLMIGSR
ncbi:hypothetical protein E2C01_024017 [Portunus trituberculatus]|uniref:Uncharacterized protein n=1 Tax=Portunus trituberculatus TaxID=210409 RepID=A0A5B7EBH9_PORTR|nr:hypothetical protein [Portunus trituberculatus]